MPAAHRCFLALLWLGSACFAAEANLTATPPSDQNAPEASPPVYIPDSLADCFRELDKRLQPEDIAQIKSGEIDPADLHFSLGMSLRNDWNLRSGSRLAKYFNRLGIVHPDDMSGIILRSYSYYLKQEPLRLAEQIAFYKKYWAEAEKEAKQRDAKKR